MKLLKLICKTLAKYYLIVSKGDFNLTWEKN
jgi:hypothetical protein